MAMAMATPTFQHANTQHPPTTFTFTFLPRRFSSMLSRRFLLSSRRCNRLVAIASVYWVYCFYSAYGGEKTKSLIRSFDLCTNERTSRCINKLEYQ